MLFFLFTAATGEEAAKWRSVAAKPLEQLSSESSQDGAVQDTLDRTRMDDMVPMWSKLVNSATIESRVDLGVDERNAEALNGSQQDQQGSSGRQAGDELVRWEA